MSRPHFDVVVFGATSFVGQILCRYLVDQFGVGGELKWAAAGRSETRLHELSDSLDLKGERLPLIVADATEPSTLTDLCRRTRVVISTVGPYALYGEPMIQACVATGTDYCDLTGEVQWIRRMIERYEDAARDSGARIVHCCGFDSIPSDLGVYFLQREAQQRFGSSCDHVKMRVRAMRGGFSGGTAASLLNVMKEASGDPALRRELADPYSLCPEGGDRVRQASNSRVSYDSDLGVWCAPFVMSAINTRVVHRSNALSQWSYGEGFRYDEAVMTGSGVKGQVGALAMMLALGGFMMAGAIRPSRWLLERFVLPAPGEGPSPAAQQRGYFDLRFFGKCEDGQTLRARVTGDRDPGYGSTAKMLGQAGACLALDIAKTDKPGGFWTPATVFGNHLIERLCAHAGLAFELIDD